jgi:hypothetical protein
MTDPATVRFTTLQKLRGLLLAGVLAWALSLAEMYGSAHVFAYLDRVYLGRLPVGDVDDAIGWTFLGAIYLGLPAAFILVLAFGFPLLRHAERTGGTSLRDAVVAGLVCGAVIGATVALLIVSTQRSDFAGAAARSTGWIKLGADFLATLLIGAAVGVSARLASGRPRAS